MSQMPKVTVDGIEYVPRVTSAREEVVRLLSELVKETPYKSELRRKASRLQYLVTDGCGRIRV